MLPALSALLYALLLLLPLAPTTVGAQVPLNLTKREQVFAFEHNFEAGRFAKIPQCQELTFGWTGDGVVDPVYLVIYGEGQRVQKMEVGQGSIGNGTAIIDADLNSVIYFTMQDGAGHSGGITGPWTIGTGNSSNCDPSPLTGSNISVSYNTPGTTKYFNGLATCPLGGLDISLLGAKGEATEVDVVLPEANPAGEYYTTLPLDHPSFSLNVSASAFSNQPNHQLLLTDRFLRCEERQSSLRRPRGGVFWSTA
ncbi:hypothetical protein BCR35DRAFT_333515 [Leucosporidium creatinivorum]|uniref:DOMON domain-containing protein n=1 Tax=Leucosporidium creatinivorum TaxID=106004 RepID=A0A1Y2ER59_9BASI|nr:hypothetical protein BCR35DRAFT_333515 [Leucosporidium creatinivorum]